MICQVNTTEVVSMAHQAQESGLIHSWYRQEDDRLIIHFTEDHAEPFGDEDAYYFLMGLMLHHRRRKAMVPAQIAEVRKLEVFTLARRAKDAGKIQGVSPITERAIKVHICDGYEEDLSLDQARSFLTGLLAYPKGRRVEAGGMEDKGRW